MIEINATCPILHLRDVEIRSLELQHPDVKEVSQARGPEPPAQRNAEALNVGGEKLRQCSKGKFPELVFSLIQTDIWYFV